MPGPTPRYPLWSAPIQIKFQQELRKQRGPHSGSSVWRVERYDGSLAYHFKCRKDAQAGRWDLSYTCLLYTSAAADDMQPVDLGGRRTEYKNTTIESQQLLTDRNSAKYA